MSAEGYIVCGLFILAIAVNSASVYAQKKSVFYPRFGKHAHTVHSIIISVFWLTFVVSYVLMEANATNNFFQNVALGVGLKAVSVVLFLLSLKEIGPGALSNKNLFTGRNKQLGSVYKYIREPMYMSYTLFIFGSGVLTGEITFYILGIICIIGLQIIEAKSESV